MGGRAVGGEWWMGGEHWRGSGGGGGVGREAAARWVELWGIQNFKRSVQEKSLCPSSVEFWYVSRKRNSTCGH